MSDTAIHVSGLSKMFKLYSRPSDMFWEIMTGKPRFRPFWALRDISLDVNRGQVVGIIGRNGAGKSTLLKIITGTLDRTDGELKVSGRISSILELGTGFSGEYSGRENIYLGGLMVGLSHQEISEKEKWIIEFSELRDFIDQPFKTYSSGMQARLTFSTALCIDPDVLIVDEALSVGDAKFQRKSFAKFEEFRNSGRTILLVSHDVNTINQICDHAVLLAEGRILEQGDPKTVTRNYERMLFGAKAETLSPPTEDPAVSSALPVNAKAERMESDRRDLIAGLRERGFLAKSVAAGARYGDRRAEIVDCGIFDADGHRVTELQVGQSYTLFSRVWIHEIVDDIQLGYGIKNTKGVEMFAVNSYIQKIRVPSQKPGDLLEGHVDICNWLAPGDYFLTTGAWGIGESSHYDRLVDAVHFRVVGDCGLLSQSLVNLQAKVDVSQIFAAD
jgi:lipopolysaccharide transport system ATP-binding protein